MCDEPASGVNAALVTVSVASTFSYQDTVDYTCVNPAAMVTQGSLTLTCKGDGEWSSSPPVCGKFRIIWNAII